MLNNPAKISFRYARPEDTHALALAHVSAVNQVAEGGIADAQKTYAAKKEKYDLLFKKGKAQDKILLASMGDELVGYLMHSVPDDKDTGTLKVEKFYVTKPGGGIGSALFERFCKLHPEARQLVLTPSDEAKGIYESFGFIEQKDNTMLLAENVLDLWRNNTTHRRPTFEKKYSEPEMEM
jgi:hypothetical protein